MNEEMINVTDIDEMNEGIFDDYSEETTDLAPVEDGEESNKIGKAEIALGALALVGAGFLVKKAYDGGKWLVGKAKDGIATLKDKKSKKGADQEEEIEEPEEAEEAAETEPEKVQGTVEN